MQCVSARLFSMNWSASAQGGSPTPVLFYECPPDIRSGKALHPRREGEKKLEKTENIKKQQYYED